MRVVGSIHLDGQKIMFGAHAVDRFRERVHPEMGFMEARAKLAELAAGGHIRLSLPPRVRITNLRDEILNDGWLTFPYRGRLVVLPLMPWPQGSVAPTCLTVKEQQP